VAGLGITVSAAVTQADTEDSFSRYMIFGAPGRKRKNYVQKAR